MTKTTDTQLIDEAALAQIEARAEAATEGPWAKYYRVSPRGAHKHWHLGNKDGLCQITMNGHERDYEFMAHARTDIPAMAATIRELWAERDDAIRERTAYRGQLIGLNTRLVEEDLARFGAGYTVGAITLDDIDHLLLLLNPAPPVPVDARADMPRRLTLPELNHLSALLEAERESGSYAGPREQYYARTERLIQWCNEQIKEKNQ